MSCIVGGYDASEDCLLRKNEIAAALVVLRDAVYLPCYRVVAWNMKHMLGSVLQALLLVMTSVELNEMKPFSSSDQSLYAHEGWALL